MKNKIMILLPTMSIRILNFLWNGILLKVEIVRIFWAVKEGENIENLTPLVLKFKCWTMKDILALANPKFHQAGALYDMDSA